MKSHIRYGALLAVTLAISGTALVGTALAAAAPAVPDSLRACAKKQDVLQRLSCYDSEIAKLDGPQAVAPAPTAAAPTAAAATAAVAVAAAAPPVAKAATPAPAAAPTPPSLGSEQLRNAPARPLGEEQVHKTSVASSLMFWKSKDKDPNKDGPDTSLTARIDSLRTTAEGLAIVTLDNGQVWRQIESEGDYPLAVGNTVRIDRAALGSYRLTLVKEGWKRWLRVTRTK